MIIFSTASSPFMSQRPKAARFPPTRHPSARSAESVPTGVGAPTSVGRQAISIVRDLWGQPPRPRRDRRLDGRYTDIGLDVQFERTLGRSGFQLYGTWIHESRRLDASFASRTAANPAGQVQTFRALASYNYRHTYALPSAFLISGGAPTRFLYAPGRVAASRLSRPRQREVLSSKRRSSRGKTPACRFNTPYTRGSTGRAPTTTLWQKRLGEQRAVSGSLYCFLFSDSRLRRRDVCREKHDIEDIHGAYHDVTAGHLLLLPGVG